MSGINSIEKIDKTRNTIQGMTRASYCVFEKEGSKYFQIDTYGSPDREYIGQPSQTIQFDRAFAKKLVSILIDEFWI